MLLEMHRWVRDFVSLRRESCFIHYRNNCCCPNVILELDVRYLRNYAKAIFGKRSGGTFILRIWTQLQTPFMSALLFVNDSYGIFGNNYKNLLNGCRIVYCLRIGSV